MMDVSSTGGGAGAAFTGTAADPDDFLAHSARPPNKANKTRITKGLIHFNRDIFILSGRIAFLHGRIYSNTVIRIYLVPGPEGVTENFHYFSD